MSEAVSPYLLIWQKLKRKPVAVSGLVVICLASLLSLFAYQVIQDNAPDANTQIVEIALAEPGSTYKILKVPKRSEGSTVSSFFGGTESNFIPLSFQEIYYEKDNISIINAYGDQQFMDYSQLLNKAESLTLDEKEEAINDLITQNTYWLGTDKFGRSMLSRLILGIRISMLAGLIAVLVSLMIGIFLGAVGGYYGGWVDRLVMYFVNILWSIPTLLLVFAIVLALGRGLGVIFIAVGLTMWVDVARIVRGQVIKLKGEQYVIAARSLGQNQFTILFKHILPNCLGPILVITAANFATAILIEAGLSYLGFGVNPPTPSLGNMLNENYGYALSGNVIIAFAPALTIMILVLAFNLLGTGLRDVFDIREE